MPDLVRYQREGVETPSDVLDLYAIRYDGDRATFMEILTYSGDVSGFPDDPRATPTTVNGAEASFMYTLPESPDDGLRVIAWRPAPNMYLRVVSGGPISDEELHRVAESIAFEEAS